MLFLVFPHSSALPMLMTSRSGSDLGGKARKVDLISLKLPRSEDLKGCFLHPAQQSEFFYFYTANHNWSLLVLKESPFSMLKNPPSKTHILLALDFASYRSINSSFLKDKKEKKEKNVIGRVIENSFLPSQSSPFQEPWESWSLSASPCPDCWMAHLRSCLLLE